MNGWDDWKERNDDWYTPFVALPVCALIILGWALTYLVFWGPWLLIGWLRDHSHPH